MIVGTYTCLILAVCMYACVCLCMYMCMFMCLCYVCVCVYVYLSVCICMCMYVFCIWRLETRDTAGADPCLPQETGPHLSLRFSALAPEPRSSRKESIVSAQDQMLTARLTVLSPVLTKGVFANPL